MSRETPPAAAVAPNPDAPRPDRATDPDDLGGPFGIDVADPHDPIHWTYYQKEGATPTRTELLLAQRIDSLAEALREFPDSLARREMLHDLHDMFAATLVQGMNVDLQSYIDDMKAKEQEFYRRIVAPEQKALLKTPTAYTAVTFVVVLILAFAFSAIDERLAFADLSWGDTIAMSVAGMLFGRLLYFAAAYGQQITSLEPYNRIKALSGTIAMSIFFDIVIGAAACLAFLSELIIIAIGASEAAPDSGISSVTIDTSYLTAFVFGIIVGFAKTEFLKKFSDVTAKALD